MIETVFMRLRVLDSSRRDSLSSSAIAVPSSCCNGSYNCSSSSITDFQLTASSQQMPKLTATNKIYDFLRNCCRLALPVLLLLLLQSESGLPCEWLDKFYAPMKGPAHSLPHEQDIFAFLHEDCTPQPPCACAGLKLDGSDAGASP